MSMFCKGIFEILGDFITLNMLLSYYSSFKVFFINVPTLYFIEIRHLSTMKPNPVMEYANLLKPMYIYITTIIMVKLIDNDKS